MRIGRKEFEGGERQRILSEMVAVVILLGLLASVGLAGEPDYSVDDIFQFKTYYYLHPEPERLGAMLHSYLNLETFTDGGLDEHDEHVGSYFFGRTARLEPVVVSEYINFFKEGNHKQRLFILKILKLCGNEETKHFFETNLRAGRFSREELHIIQALRDGIPTKFDPVAEPITSPADLDFLWMEFEATGSEEVVKRIVAVLHWVQNGKGLETVIGSTAKSSLACNCRKHERVLEICKEELSNSTGVTREILQKVVSEKDCPASVRESITEGRHQEVPRDVKAWALSCVSLLWERNHDPHDSLAGEAMTDRNMQVRRKFISEEWGIESRVDLLDSLRWINEGGHRRSFETLGKSVCGTSKWRYALVLLGNVMNAEYLREIVFVRKHYEEVGEEGILGWDYSRYIALCRWGHEAGYVSEDEAWRMIMPVAWRLQEEFDSWEDLSRNYLIGREFWGGGADSTYKFEDAYQRLIDMPSSPWNRYDWYMDLRYFADNQDKRVRQDDD